jgi:hypothetical protein
MASFLGNGMSRHWCRLLSLICVCVVVACAPTRNPGMPVSASLGPMGGANERFAPRDMRQGCFSGQMLDTAWANQAAASTVQIISFDPSGQGKAYTGSGFIVAHSGNARDGRNRILTGLHVVADALLGGGTVTIVSSSGMALGDAEIITGAVQSRQSNGLPRGDVVVMQLKTFFPGGRGAYDKIPGLELAPAQPRRVLEGTFSNPGGIAPGTSGGPVLDSQGRVIGLLLRSDDKAPDPYAGDWRLKSRIHAATLTWNGSQEGGGVTPHDVVLPYKTISYAEPVVDTHVLGSLGAMGSTVNPDISGERWNFKNVEVLGFPLQACVVYKGDMRIP